MRRVLIPVILLAVSVSLLSQPSAHADSLKVQPLIYKETISGSERKRGYIDVSNPTGRSQVIAVAVKAFRQVDNGNRLEFYDDKQLKEAIVIERSSFDLLPRQAIRVYFGVDAKKLPGGDVLAAVLFTTSQPKVTENLTTVSQSVGVGTLLTFMSDDDARHNAEIVKTNIPYFQLGNKLRGSYTIKNTAPLDEPNAFYPLVERSYSPFGAITKQEGGLLSAGVVRTTQFSSNENMFGFYEVKIKFKESVQSKWVFVILGWGWVVALSIISFFAAVIVMIFKLRTRTPKT